MLLEDHKRRVARLLRGERKVADLHSLFSDLRMHQPGRATVQEIGHFAAHRYERDKGISLARANDIQTSARLWQLQQDGRKPSAEHLKEAGYANLRIIPTERIREHLGISRQTAEQSFAKAIKKYAAELPLKEREFQALKLFGLSMMWQFALCDEALWKDFVDLLVDEGSLAEEQRSVFEPVLTFVNLYALNIMHGARLRMTDGTMTQLRLAASAESGLLRIKANILVSDTQKPVTISVPIFESSLMAVDYCDPSILTMLDEVVPTEIDGEKLVALT